MIVIRARRLPGAVPQTWRRALAAGMHRVDGAHQSPRQEDGDGGGNREYASRASESDECDALRAWPTLASLEHPSFRIHYNIRG